ncbi:MAG: hypothetical protein WAW61_01325 [Methylococcaceae bacterium]
MRRRKLPVYCRAITAIVALFDEYRKFELIRLQWQILDLLSLGQACFLYPTFPCLNMAMAFGFAHRRVFVERRFVSQQ